MTSSSTASSAATATTSRARSDGSILQALNLMNNNFIVKRSRDQPATNASQLIAQNLTKSNTDLINDALTSRILSRYPARRDAQKIATLPASGATRTAAIQDLVWSLYNKVDFVFNY